MTGRVTKSVGSTYLIKLDDGNVVSASLRGKLRLIESKATNPVVVGDFVDVEKQDEWVITTILPRRNKMTRSAIGNENNEHVLAANVDQVVIVSSLVKPAPKFNFIDRCLVAAQSYRIPAILVFTKADLTENFEEVSTGIRELYSGCTDGIYFENLLLPSSGSLFKSVFQNKLSSLTGLSGVGKTTLISSLNADLALRIGKTSEKWNQGKHTTSNAELFEVMENSFIIDTPGLREFGLMNIDAYELSHFFREMVPYLEDCKFSKCTHTHEPICAVKSAIEKKLIHPMRYESYLQMLKDLK